MGERISVNDLMNILKKYNEEQITYKAVPNKGRGEFKLKNIEINNDVIIIDNKIQINLKDIKLINFMGDGIKDLIKGDKYIFITITYNNNKHVCIDIAI